MSLSFDFPTVAEILYPLVANIIYPPDEKENQKGNRRSKVDKTATSSRHRAHTEAVDSSSSTPSVSFQQDSVRHNNLSRVSTRSSPSRPIARQASLIDVDIDDYVLILCPDEELMRWRRNRSQSQPPAVATISEEVNRLGQSCDLLYQSRESEI